jgi:hypothetical protein
MGQLTEQVIKQWSQILAPQTPSPLSLFEPDIKTSWGKSAIKSEILTPSHAVSISPISFKVEVDPFVYLDRNGTLSHYAQKFFTIGLTQSVDIKATGKLAFKGDKEVAFKSKSNVEYSSGKEKDEQGNGKEWSKILVGVTIATSVIAAIGGEVLASQKLKTQHKILWWSHAGVSRFLSIIFSLIQREKIKIELAETVREAKAGDDAAAKARADTERDNAINLALNPVMAALNLAAADAAARADAAAETAQAAQATANRNNDALTETIKRLSRSVDRNEQEINQRLHPDSGVVRYLHQMVHKHQKDIAQLQQNGTGAAAAS